MGSIVYLSGLALVAGSIRDCEEALIAGARDTVEGGLGRAVRLSLVGGHADVALEDESCGADAVDSVVVRVDRAVGNLLAFSVKILGAFNADAGLDV